MKTVTVNKEQGLYVIPCGTGYSCLGFDVADKRRVAYLKWLGQCTNAKNPIGTLEAYKEYLAAIRAVEMRCVETKTHCPAELTPELIGLEGKRVEVSYPDGAKERFWVGKSTGRIPIHIEIKTRRSLGGSAVYFPAGSTVRVVDGGPR